MIIEEATKKLYKDYKKDPPLYCLDRAIILYCIMKDKESSPKIEYFFCKDNEWHHIVILENEVYDCNGKITPTSISEYKEKEKKRCYPLKLIWKDSRNLIKQNRIIEDSFEHLLRFDPEFQEEIKPLIEKHFAKLLL